MLVSTWEHKEARQSITVEQVGASQFTVTLAGCVGTTVPFDTLCDAMDYARGMKRATLRDLAFQHEIVAYLADKH